MSLPKNKILVIFDFDETLCKTNGLVYISDKLKNKVIAMSPGQYSDWRELDEYEQNPLRWDMDFSEFTGYPKKGIAIDEIIKKLIDYIETKNVIVAIVTGRDELLGPKSWLEKYIGNENLNKVILMCSGDPNKRMCYESLINTLEPVRIKIYEDSIYCINQCKEVCQKYNLNLISTLVTFPTMRIL